MTAVTATPTTAPVRAAAKPWYKVLYVQVLIAIVLGALFGWLAPDFATNDWIKALGDGFIKLIKMVIAPIIFCTVVSGISHIQDAKKVGRIGVKALVYFEVVSTFALIIGLIVGNVVRPGAGFGGAAANAQAVATYAKQAEAQKSVDFFLHIIPDTVVGAFAQAKSCRFCCSRSCSDSPSWRLASAAIRYARSSTTRRMPCSVSSPSS